jgi:hypothetical protein
MLVLVHLGEKLPVQIYTEEVDEPKRMQIGLSRKRCS